MNKDPLRMKRLCHLGAVMWPYFDTLASQQFEPARPGTTDFAQEVDSCHYYSEMELGQFFVNVNWICASSVAEDYPATPR